MALLQIMLPKNFLKYPDKVADGPPPFLTTSVKRSGALCALVCEYPDGLQDQILFLQPNVE
jgi:hypothetical protein